MGLRPKSLFHNSDAFQAVDQKWLSQRDSNDVSKEKGCRNPGDSAFDEIPSKERRVPAVPHNHNKIP
jgi:hypothetical protein